VDDRVEASPESAASTPVAEAPLFDEAVKFGGDFESVGGGACSHLLQPVLGVAGDEMKSNASSARRMSHGRDFIPNLGGYSLREVA